MIEQIKEVFSNCDNLGCHQRLRQSFFLKDENPGICKVLLTNNDATCFIHNKSNIEIDFLAIDNCLIKQQKDLKKCDAVVKGNKQIWFIELKEVNWASDSSLNSQKRNNGRKKAVEQIASTINHLKGKGIDLSNYEIRGLISFPPYANEVNPISIPKASSQVRIAEFASSCGYTELQEGNLIVF